VNREGTSLAVQAYAAIADDPVDNEGNEPLPLLLIAFGAAPLLGFLGWYFGILG